MAVKITPTNNGPYMVEGEVELVSPSGKPIPTKGGKTFLCRCGGSTNKPFCDGTHSKTGFQAAEAAVAAQEG
ncbi:MAG: CDGSH iron-sulfur domain-containing protein [Chloroflexi bacterium]|nr:CDGSH iron-sulfur domain-containing protein [Chloroflexota bacterium]